VNTEVVLILRDGEVTALYNESWDLYGFPATDVVLTLTTESVMARAQMENDLLSYLNDGIATSINDTVTGIGSDLAAAEEALARQQAELAELDAQIDTMRQQVRADRQAAQKAVNDALGDLNAKVAEWLALDKEIKASRPQATRPSAMRKRRSTAREVR
jgi:DNA-binding protein H-NS